MRSLSLALATVLLSRAAGVTYSNDYHPNHVSAVRVDRMQIKKEATSGGDVSLWAEPCNFSTTDAWTTLSWSGVPNPDVGDFIGPFIAQRIPNKRYTTVASIVPRSLICPQ